MNGQTSGAKLPESDREDMEVFLGKIYQLLPVLGVELLVTSAGKAVTDAEKEMLYCEIKGLKAKGRLTPNGFIVLKGSQPYQKIVRHHENTHGHLTCVKGSKMKVFFLLLKTILYSRVTKNFPAPVRLLQ